MAVLTIRTYPDPILLRKCEPVKEIGPWEKRLVRDMIETMFAAPGAGLAAPQVGVSLRIIVINLADDDRPGQAMVMINPEIISQEGEILSAEEGCLSIPDYLAEVKRYGRVLVKFLDMEGKEREVEGRDFLARVFQHEIDHLAGTLFIDRLGRVKRDLVKRRLLKRSRKR